MSEEVKVPLSEFVRQIAREAAQAVIQKHIESCPGPKKAEALEKRVGVLEKRLIGLVAFMLGSGGLGGVLGGLIVRFLFGA